MSEEDQQRPKEGQNEPPSIHSLPEIILQAQESYKGVHPNQLHLGTILQLYGSLLRLSGDTSILIEINRYRSKINRGTLEAWSAFFHDLRDFEACMARLDLAILDLYYPGLVAGILDGINSDMFVLVWYERYLVPEFGLDKQNPPVDLERIMRDLNLLVPHSHKGRQSSFDYGALLRRPLDQRDVELENLRGILSKSRVLVGKLIQDHWSLRDLVENSRPEQLFMEVTVGDKFNRVNNSTIVNRSTMYGSFNDLRYQPNQETAHAMKLLADEIERTGNREAGEHFNALNEELQKAEPKKAVLRTLWTGVTMAMPTLAQMTDVVTRISELIES